MNKKIGVLIVDDSAVVRQTLSDILSSDPQITVIGTASNPLIAAERLKKIIPDVITLDVEMPVMDGITFLQKLMSQHPIPVVIVSSLAGKGSETALRAMECGAVEVIQKPRVSTKQFFEEAKIFICDTVKAAASARLSKISAPRKVKPKLAADTVIVKMPSRVMLQTTERVVVIGASTGGVEALRFVVEALPGDAPGTVIVQHMPEGFTSAFARRLDSLCRVTVKEAKNNDTVLRGHVLIAAGNHHLLLKRSGARYYVEIKDGPLISRHRPSVDVLFRSAAQNAGKNATGIIMTGMGDDGAKGLLEMKQAGALTVAQDESSCVVFGMPKKAIEINAADMVAPLSSLPSIIMERSS